jgi:hypothetical protein
MNATKWLACRTSRTMLDALRGKLSERKLRLIGCACAAHLAGRLELSDCLTALELAEKVADGVATKTAALKCHRLAVALGEVFSTAVARLPRQYKDYTARRVASVVSQVVGDPDPELPDRRIAVHDLVAEALEDLGTIWASASKERLRQAHIVREIVGNPFRSAAFNPAWRTSDVLLLAQGIYEVRAFDRMPILADALQDAGCTNEDILDHCRDASATHARGCWVVDLVLGKE